MRQIILLLLLLTGALTVYGRSEGCRQCQYCQVNFSNKAYIGREEAMRGLRAFLAQCATGEQYDLQALDPVPLDFIDNPDDTNCDPHRSALLCKRWVGFIPHIWRLCGNGGSYTGKCHDVGDGRAIIFCVDCYHSVHCANHCSCDYCGCDQPNNSDSVQLCTGFQ